MGSKTVIFDRRKFGELLSENVNNEVKPSDINLNSFKPQKKLNTRFWIKDKLNSNVRLRLLDIADDFIDGLALEFKPVDIVITGSLANFNWSKYSDIDLHIIVNFSELYNDKEILQDYFDTKRREWNEEHEKLSIYGFPVEIYVEDVDEPSYSDGIYSIEKNNWIRKPEDKPIQLDKKVIKQIASDIMTKIDEYESFINKEDDAHRLEGLSNRVKRLWNEIRDSRKRGLEEEGEMSTSNIIYKVLRRTGYIDKLFNLKKDSYDKINSID